MNWLRLEFRSKLDGDEELVAKTHFVQSELVGVVVAGLEKRGSFVDRLTSVDKYTFDPGGFFLMGMPFDEVLVRGIVFRFACSNVDDIAMTLTKLAPRIEYGAVSGICYYKLHGLHNCLVMDGSMLEDLKSAIGQVRDSSNCRYEKFMNERKSEREVLVSA